MNTEAQIQQAYAEAKNYPDLASKLIAIGVDSYTVDTATGTMLYRFAAGEFVLHDGEALRKINPVFNQEATIQAIRDSQQRKIDYSGFMDAIAVAGVRFYEATLVGPNPRVTYIGTGGFYEEKIPV